MTSNQRLDEYRRNLPHIQPKDGMFFITFRIYGTIPLAKLNDLKTPYLNTNTTDISGLPIKQLKQNQQEEYFMAFDELLDTNLNGPYYLANPEIAKLVCDAIKHRDGKDYKLVCFCVMSNHVHLIIYKLAKPLHIVMKELKSYTGKEAMKILKDSEAPASLLKTYSMEQALRVPSVASKFWQPESFDRIIRDRNDMAEKIKYTLNNPVKAGLANHWKQWKWSYCWPEFLE